MRMGLLPFDFLLGLLLGLLLLALSSFDWSALARPWIKTVETNIQIIVNADSMQQGERVQSWLQGWK